MLAICPPYFLGSSFFMSPAFLSSAIFLQAALVLSSIFFSSILQSASYMAPPWAAAIAPTETDAKNAAVKIVTSFFMFRNSKLGDKFERLQ